MMSFNIGNSHGPGAGATAPGPMTAMCSAWADAFVCRATAMRPGDDHVAINRSRIPHLWVFISIVKRLVRQSSGRGIDGKRGRLAVFRCRDLEIARAAHHLNIRVAV